MTVSKTVTRGSATPPLTDVVDAARAAASVVSVTNQLSGVVYTASSSSGYTASGTTSFSLTWVGAGKPAPGETYIVIYNIDPGFLLKGTDFVKAAFVAGLRAAYSEQTFFDLYKYNTNDTLSALSIYESFPKRPLKSPAIIVSTGPGDMSRTTLDSEDFLLETKTSLTPTGLHAWGKMAIDVKIQILALTDRDRRKLTDLTALFCRHLFSSKFSAFGIGYKTVTIDGENEITWQGQLLYTNGISIPCHTEWQIKYAIGLVDVIDDIVVDITESL